MNYRTALGCTLVRHDEVKFWFPCSETSGTLITDAIRGIQIAPSDVGDGSLAFTVPHTVTVINNTTAEPLPLHRGTWPELVMSKVLINAAIVKTVDGSKCKIPIGASATEYEKFSVSFADSLHAIIRNSLEHSVAASPVNPGTLSSDTDYILWEMWDGVNSTLSSGALNHDGSIAQSTTSPNDDLYLSITDASAFAGIPTIQPASGTNLDNVHCYGWGLWQFDAVPANLYGWLATIAAQCVAGNKTPWAVT